MADEWEDNSGEAVSNISIAAKKKWDDEDKEEDAIKDSWDASSSSDDEDDEDKPTTETAPKKKTISIAQKVAERQAAELKVRNNDENNGLDAPGKKIGKPEEMTKNLSIKEGDVSPLDRINPKTKDEFDEFSLLLIERIRKHEKQVSYPNFINGFVRDLCSTLNDADFRKVNHTLTTVATERKSQKDSLKQKKKKPQLVVESQDLKNFEYEDEDFDYFI